MSSDDDSDDDKRRQRRRVWFHRVRAVVWAVFGVVSFVTGLANNIALVWFASVYANVVSDWTAGEAADDGKIVARLDEIAERQGTIDAKLDALLSGRPYPGDHGRDQRSD